MAIRKALLFCFILGAGCTSNAKLPQSQFYTPQSAALNLTLPGQEKAGLEYDQFGSKTKKTYQKYIDQVAPNQRDKLLFYSHLIDEPEKTSYTGLGKIINQIDTTSLKTQGFVNRTLNNQPYLHKRVIDRRKKIATAEYVVKVDSGYFYLFSYAPIGHLLHNEEDVIIAQDSLSRKHGAVIGSLRRR